MVWWRQLYLVSNNGVAPSGTIDVGMVCPDGATVGCTWSSQVESIPPGETSEIELTLILPQGETTISVFAGALEEGYRWGDANVQEITVGVPLKDIGPTATRKWKSWLPCAMKAMRKSTTAK